MIPALPTNNSRQKSAVADVSTLQFTTQMPPGGVHMRVFQEKQGSNQRIHRSLFEQR